MKKALLIVAAIGLVLVAQASFGGTLSAPVGGVSIGNAVPYTNHADPLLVDRGLPSVGVYAGGTNPNWSLRSNIGDGDFDAQDPIWVNNNYGPPELAGDTFTLPTSAYVTDVRLWLDPNNGAASYAAAFQSVSLMLGSNTPNPAFSWSYQPGGAWNGGSFPANGPLPLSSSSMSLLPGAPTETDVTYPGAPVNPNTGLPYMLWQLDFPVNQTLAAGNYSFAIDPVAYACPYNISGNGESYYIAFLDETMQGFSSGYPNDSSRRLRPGLLHRRHDLRPVYVAVGRSHAVRHQRSGVWRSSRAEQHFAVRVRGPGLGGLPRLAAMLERVTTKSVDWLGR